MSLPSKESGYSSLRSSTNNSDSTPSIHSKTPTSLYRSHEEFELIYSTDNDNKRASEAKFLYYLPHASTSTRDFYTELDWVAYDIIERLLDSPIKPMKTKATQTTAEPKKTDPTPSDTVRPPSEPAPNELGETSAALFAHLELPFIHEQEWNYYPPQSDPPYHSSDESLLIQNPEPKRSAAEKGAKKLKKTDDDFWVEDKIDDIVASIRRMDFRRKLGLGGKWRWNFRP
ncbi:hypothetical protein B0J11DRAFT_510120 [Dendryphion nanum]|uniref:Uncharacterized protein n=1 Tax=Dendryphion nanum TaxID=256645 RepID=A0A9P9DE63_9PLEO|nr:hypothetical protein B0J11DRAFT_510120 [Dendryphion nanum]